MPNTPNDSEPTHLSYDWALTMEYAKKCPKCGRSMKYVGPSGRYKGFEVYNCPKCGINIVILIVTKA